MVDTLVFKILETKRFVDFTCGTHTYPYILGEVNRLLYEHNLAILYENGHPIVRRGKPPLTPDLHLVTP